MSLRIVMSLVAVISCTLIGRSIGGGNARRAKLLADTMDGIQLLKVYVVERRIPLLSAMRRSNSPLITAVSARMDDISSMEAWKITLDEDSRKGGLLDCLTDADIDVFTSFFDALGTTGKSEHRALFDSVIRSLGHLEAEARKTGGDKAKLYTTLGMLGGFAVVIAFI